MKDRSPQSPARRSLPLSGAAALVSLLMLAHCSQPAPEPPQAAPSKSPAASTPAPTAGEARAQGPVPPLVPGVSGNTLSAPDLASNPVGPRKEKQMKEALAELKVFHDFQFTDRQVESGITFSSRVVDDAARSYKLVHYDHGFGVVVADVDGDGREDIYFLTQLGRNELWKNLGNGKFKDITEEAGVALKDQISVSAVFADIDNDGDEDLYVTTVRHGNHLFENDGKGHFKDITKTAGLEYSGHSSSAVFFDYDNDGKLDLFLVNVGVYSLDIMGPGGYNLGMSDAFQGHLQPDRREASILYHNLGGNKFQDVSAEMGLIDESWSGDATIADFNGDGWPDLYVLNMQGDDHYWENDHGKRFVDKTHDYFPKTPWGAMGITMIDYDNDGKLDLFLTDMHSDMTAKVGPEEEKKKSIIHASPAYLQGGDDNIFGNALWHNLGGGKFEEVSDKMGVENYWPWGVSAGDLNADGFEDLFITASMNYPWRYQENSLLLNNQGQKFVDSEFVLGVEPRQDGRIEKPWFEVDCDGADRDHMACGGRHGKVTVLGTLGSRASALFDIDGDGDVDIVTNEFNSEPMVLVSNLAEKTKVHFLKVKLQGKRSNRDGLGAVVQVTAGGKIYTRYHDGKSGYLSHSMFPLYFGLGAAAKVDRVEVRWQGSEKTQAVTSGIPANGLLTVVEE